MGLQNSHARMLGMCGVITLLLLHGVSCGSGDLTSGVSKSVSAAVTVRGVVWHDVNKNGTFDIGDHTISGQEVRYALNGNVIAYTYTNGNGQYELDIPDQEGYLTPYLYPSDINVWYPLPVHGPFDNDFVQNFYGQGY